MGTKYRVDRNDSHVTTPVGMTSILIITNNYQEACKVFNRAQTGLSPWNQPDEMYGVTLAEWNARKQDYVVLKHKGIPMDFILVGTAYYDQYYSWLDPDALKEGRIIVGKPEIKEGESLVIRNHRYFIKTPKG